MGREERIAENLTAIQQRVADAAERSGRTAADVTLVGVTKYVGVPETEALIAAGCRDLGESRPQELWAKAAALSDLGRSAPAPAPARADPPGAGLRWHLIGHLQRNKVKRTLPLLWLTHSGDSLRLLKALDQSATALQGCARVLLEVNISGDDAKHGFAPDELPVILPQLAELKQLHVQGLMAMARLAGDAEAARRDFAALRELRDRLRPGCPAEVGLDQLSMGMSRDFEVAIEEGATMVRVGSALFEGVAG